VRLLGHTFLRSNYETGDPVAVTAEARQQRRVANVLKHIQGIGCRILKPIDSDGKNWLIVVDGNSDIEPPSDWTPPFVYDHPFRVTISGPVDNRVGTMSWGIIGWGAPNSSPSHGYCQQWPAGSTLNLTGLGVGEHIWYFHLTCNANNPAAGSITLYSTSLATYLSSTNTDISTDVPVFYIKNETVNGTTHTTMTRQELFCDVMVPVHREALLTYNPFSGNIEPQPTPTWKVSWYGGRTYSNTVSGETAP